MTALSQRKQMLPLAVTLLLLSTARAHVGIAYEVVEFENGVTLDVLELDATTPEPELEITTTTPRATMAPPPPTIVQTTAPTPISLASVVPTPADIPGLGTVNVYVNALALGVPSFLTETAFNPVEGIHIIVPAGAWTPEARRADQTLTLTVFDLPRTLATPGASCGPAIDIAPRTKRLAKAITVSTPCAAGRVFALNTSSRAWTPDNTTAEAGAWATTTKMGIHAAMTQGLTVVTHDDEAAIVGGIVGGVIAGIALSIGIAVACAHRRGKVTEQQTTVSGQLSFVA